MGATPATKRLFDTNEFERMGQCGIFREDDRVELIEGEVVTMTPIGSDHSGHVKRIAACFYSRAGGEAIVSVQDPVRLGEHSEPQPDVALLRYRDDFYSSAHPGPEDIFLIVEVAERSLDYDRDIKLPVYAKWGIPTVWLVNLPDRQLEVYREPTEGSYSRKELATPDRELTVEGLAGFAVPASQVLPEMTLRRTEDKS